MSDNECVNKKMFAKVAPLEINKVKMFDCVNVLENVLDSVNVSVGGRHSSIVIPLDTFESPNDSP